MASRPAPGWSGWTALAGVSAVGYCLADRRRRAWWIVLAVEVVQVCLHVWFSCCTPADPGSAPGNVGMAMPGGVHQATGAVMPMSHGGGMSAGMFGVHALAGVLVGVWLHAGERALWHALGLMVGLLLGRTLRVFFLFLCGGLTAYRRLGGTAHQWVRDEAEPALAVLRHALVRRGPPAVAVVRVHASV